MTTLPGNSANGALPSPTSSTIEVASGGFVDLLNPDPSTLNLADIARGMAFTCRYGGVGIDRFYSVAEHAVLVHDLMQWQGRAEASLIGALFHDAAEAYLGDVVSPLKWALRAEEFRSGVAGPCDAGERQGAYDRITERMEDAICDRFGVEWYDLSSPGLRTADMWALRIEAAAFTASGGARWHWTEELPNDGKLPKGVSFRGGMSPDGAMAHWLACVNTYNLAAA